MIRPGRTALRVPRPPACRPPELRRRDRGGCPAGAAVLSTSSFNTALGSSHFGSGKRVLFKCGDTFTGDNATLKATTWSVGAYGGCEGTQTNRPIFNDTGSGHYQLSH